MGTRTDRHSLLSIFAIALYLLPIRALAADLYADASVGARYISNVYLDAWPEQDLVIAPDLDVGAAFADLWSLGYAGHLDIYLNHADLFFHKHALYAIFNPTWGNEDENGVSAELSFDAQKNTDTYASINFVSPTFDVSLVMEPTLWLRWTLSLETGYRLFYNDPPSDSFDTWIRGSVTFTMQTRTTISPNAAYGHRLYPRQDLSLTEDTRDQQLVLGMDISQGLWTTAGLRGTYAYLHNADECGLILRNFSTTEFNYIGEDFLFSGHRIGLGFKQIFTTGWMLGWDLQYETRTYTGWLVSNENGNNNQGHRDTDRQDQRFGPGGAIQYNWLPDEGDVASIPNITVALTYGYLRQWSNDAIYNTDQHVLGLAVDLSW
ncbi:MAG: hypothetical protein QNJ97_19000 [Myxococcota bacterium]|nr:hypothetical protein [Myxococcota bacterium]